MSWLRPLRPRFMRPIRSVGVAPRNDESDSAAFGRRNDKIEELQREIRNLQAKLRRRDKRIERLEASSQEITVAANAGSRTGAVTSGLQSQVPTWTSMVDLLTARMN